jgi:phage replication O-like protein O
MTNIVHFDKSRGFTRMDNALMESLATVDLPARDLRVLMAIARQTIGYQLNTKRLSADDIGKLTNMRRDVTSKSISHLLERRIIYRVGGSRGDIGISPVGEWAFYEEKQDRLTETKTSHSAQIVSLRSDASETKTATCLLYTKKETLLTLPSEEINPPLAKPKRAPRKPKPECASDFGKIQMLANNPHLITEQLISDWLKVRKVKRAAMSQTVWDSLNAELDRCVEAGISADVAMKQAVLQGWQGFRMEWVAKRLAEDNKQSGSSTSPDFYSTAWRTDTSNDL